MILRKWRDSMRNCSVFVMVMAAGAGNAIAAAPLYRSPIDVAFSPDGALVAVCDHTAGKLVLLDAGTKTVKQNVDLKGNPTGVAWSPDCANVYVSERGAATVAEIRVANARVARRFTVGRYPEGLALAGNRLLAADGGQGCVSIVDLSTGAEVGRVDCVTHCRQIAVTPDGAMAVVGNLIPFGDARNAGMAAAVTLIDVAGAKKIADIALPAGSINVRGVAVSPDGKWAYVVHSVGRFTLPTTQLERGWVMTHGMSIIDLTAKAHYATVLMDSLQQGAADPWGIRVSADGGAAWITLAGVHQVASLDLATLHALLDGKAPRKTLDALPRNSVWHAIAKDPSKRALLANDLAALYTCGAIRRSDIKAQGPRGLTVAPDGKTLAVASYFSGDVVFLDAATLTLSGSVTLGVQPLATPERLGERYYYDAKHSFQNWLSCASCHPETRADGLNWDLLNDGIGNPKNTKSHVFSAQTPPVMISGVRPDMETAAEKGFMFAHFKVASPEVMDSVRAYLRAFRPDPSPYLDFRNGEEMDCKVCHVDGRSGKKRPDGHRSIEGSLTRGAKRGMALFYDKAVGCATCHSGPLFTNMKMYDTGTRHELDRRDDWDTPTLHELWRSAPYLHDGSAPTMMDVLTTHNKGDKHGKTSHLSEEKKKDLAEFLNSL